MHQNSFSYALHPGWYIAPLNQSVFPCNDPVKLRGDDCIYITTTFACSFWFVLHFRVVCAKPNDVSGPVELKQCLNLLFAGKYEDTFEGFLRRHMGQEEVEFHVKKVEGMKFLFHPEWFFPNRNTEKADHVTTFNETWKENTQFLFSKCLLFYKILMIRYDSSSNTHSQLLTSLCLQLKCL